MARKSLGTLTLDLIAKVGGFEQGMDKASRKSSKTVKKLEKHANQIGKAFATASAAAVAGMTAMVVSTANNAREIKNLAALSDSSTQQFQRLSYAAKRYGVEQDKVSDILKDTNDRIGDFIQTGAGPMADFFENIAPKVGVTADEFARLSGPEALQLYVKSLEDAELSQKDMTFYMEAIASDATALLPLLRDNGKQMKTLGDEAERTGNVFSDLDFQQLEAIRTGMDELTGAATGMKNELVMGALPAVEDLVEFLSDDQTLQSAQALGSAIISAMNKAAQAVDGAIKITQFLAEELAAMTNGAAADDIVRLEDELENLYSMLDNPTNRVRFFGKDGIVAYYDEDEIWQMIADTENKIVEFRKRMSKDSRNAPPVSLVEPPEIPGTASGAVGDTRPPSGKGDTVEQPTGPMDSQVDVYEQWKGEQNDQFESARQFLLTPVEAEKEQYQARMEMFREYLDSGLGEQTEVNEMMEREQKRHQEKMAKIDQAKFDKQLEGASMLFGNLSTLMNSENKKLFEIGKAAAMAQAVVAGIEATIHSYNFGAELGGPYLGAAFAAAAVAATGAKIAQLGSLQFGGGASVSSGGAGTGGAGVYQPTQPNIPSGASASEDDRRGVQINFNGPVNGLDADQIARSIKDHLESTDFVLIESSTRNGRALRGV